MDQQRLYSRYFFLAFVSQAGFIIATTLMAHYGRWITFLGGSVSDVGWIIGAGSLGGLLLRPWIGQCTDRYGTRNTWLAGNLLFAAAAAGNLWLYDLGWPIFLLRMSMVASTAMVTTSSLTYITLIAPQGRETEAIGILGVGGFAGFCIGPFLGDLILDAEVFQRNDFISMFQSSILILVLPTALLFFLRKGEPLQQHSKSGWKHLIQTLRSYWPGPILWVNMNFGIALTVPLVFLAKFIDDEGLKLASFSEMGLFFICYSTIGAAIRVFFRSLPERVGRRKMLVAGMAVMTLGMLSFIAINADSAWMLAISGLICGSGHSLMFHTGTSLAIESFPPEHRGTGATLSLMAQDFGMIASAPILGLLAEHFGYASLFAAIAAVYLLTGSLYTLSCIPYWRSQAVAESA